MQIYVGGDLWALLLYLPRSQKVCNAFHLDNRKYLPQMHSHHICNVTKFALSPSLAPSASLPLPLTHG